MENVLADQDLSTNEPPRRRLNEAQQLTPEGEHVVEDEQPLSGTASEQADIANLPNVADEEEFARNIENVRWRHRNRNVMNMDETQGGLFEQPSQPSQQEIGHASVVAQPSVQRQRAHAPVIPVPEVQLPAQPPAPAARIRPRETHGRLMRLRDEDVDPGKHSEEDETETESEHEGPPNTAQRPRLAKHRVKSEMEQNLLRSGVGAHRARALAYGAAHPERLHRPAYLDRPPRPPENVPEESAKRLMAKYREWRNQPRTWVRWLTVYFPALTATSSPGMMIPVADEYVDALYNGLTEVCKKLKRPLPLPFDINWSFMQMEMQAANGSPEFWAFSRWAYQFESSRYANGVKEIQMEVFDEIIMNFAEQHAQRAAAQAQNVRRVQQAQQEMDEEEEESGEDEREYVDVDSD